MKQPVSPWPEADLKSVPKCPICGCANRVRLHEGLTDRVFGVADGSWTIYRCDHCGSGYLDPRPTDASIGRAYAGYYTHEAEDHPIVSRRGWLRTFLHDAINGYQNRRYGFNRKPASHLGARLLPLLPSLRSAADAECRHLPPICPNRGRLLDVGCGNGGFLALARQAGWTVEGIDFDAGAVQAARSRGLMVQQGGIEVLDGQQHESFDVITLCHVIEHVPDPCALLGRLYALLKPGGMLWLETPNLNSLGARRFGENWRALEPPRHLVLFNASSLRKTLRKAGFLRLQSRWHGMSVFIIYPQSRAIEDNRNSPESRSRPPLFEMVAEFHEWLRPAAREFLTYTAYK